MLNDFRLNPFFAALLLVIPLTAAIPSDTEAGGFEGPPVDNSTERLTGPAIVGTLMITPTNSINIEFAGRCGDLPVHVGPTGLPIAFTDENINPEKIKEFDIGNIAELGLSACYPPTVVDGRLIVIAVTRFTKDSTKATADLVIMAAVLK